MTARRPHNNFPTEILENIFSQGVSPHDAITFPPDRSQWPWPLLRVNKQWQAVARANPDLWRKHEVAISRSFDSSEAERVIRHHARSISKSLRVRLSIELSCSSRTHSPTAVWKLIVPNAHRIVELKMNFVHYSALDCFFNKDGAVQFPSMVSLELNFESFAPNLHTTNQILSTHLFNSPSLRSLTLHDRTMTEDFVDTFMAPSSFTWTQLTYLNLSFLPLDIVHRVLSRCTNLLHFSGFQLSDGVVPPEANQGYRLPHLQSFTLTERIPHPNLLFGLPIHWDRLSVLDLGSREVTIDAVLAILQKCPSLTALSADVHPPPRHYIPITLRQVHLPYLTTLRLNLDDGNLLRCLVVPRLTSFHVNTHDRDGHTPVHAPTFPADEILTMFQQSRISGRLVDFQRRRRHFYTEPQAIDPGPRDLIYLPDPHIRHLISSMDRNARSFVLSGVVMPRHVLIGITNGNILSAVQHLEFAVVVDDIKGLVSAMHTRVQQGPLRSAKFMVPGIPDYHLDKCNDVLRQINRKYRASFLVVRAEDEIAGPPTDEYNTDDTDSSSDSSKSSANWRSESDSD
ncbi:hypothetical protein DXG01_000347 [Tephrocybe rancida]|nr:hypothetical protein DXG01_000347 [Tephrocybe rancida]